MNPIIFYNTARLDVIDLIPVGAYPNILEVGGSDFLTLRKLGNDYSAKRWNGDLRRLDVKFDTFIEGSITDRPFVAQLPMRRVALIVANNMIEQTEKFFRVLRTLLRKGGILALSVLDMRQIRTAYQTFLRGTFPRDKAGLFDRTHLRWFCRQGGGALANGVRFMPRCWCASRRLAPAQLARFRVAELLVSQNLFVFAK